MQSRSNGNVPMTGAVSPVATSIATQFDLSPTFPPLVPATFATQAEKAPDAPALVCEGAVVSYSALDQRARGIALHLVSLGVGSGSVVGLCVKRGVDFVAAALGILKSGAAYLPLDPANPDQRLHYILADAGVRVVLTHQCGVEALRGPWRTLVLDGDRSYLESPPDCALPDTNDPSALAYVIYTSGSTGKPKGAEITHGALAHLVAWHNRTFGVSPHDRASQIASPGFDAAVWEIWPYLSAGACLYFPDDAARVDPSALQLWLTANEITVAFVPTPLAERMLALEWEGKCSLRFLLTGGDALHSRPSERIPFPLVNNYGPTECTVVATSGIVHPRETGTPSIGKPVEHAAIYLLDQDLKPVSPGEVGEIYIGGDAVALGYRNAPDLTAQRFLADPFSSQPNARMFRTGDLARSLSSGELAFLGRRDDQVKIRGNRVELEEISTALRQHASVHECAVTARPDVSGELAVLAYVVPAAEDVSASDLHEHLRQQLPDYMIPSAFVRLDSLPLLHSGKIDKASLPEPTSENLLPVTTSVEPRNDIEEQLSEMLRTLLQVPAVGIDDNFFLLGGHSLLGTQLIARIRKTFEVSIPLRTLFQNPTVAELSAEIERLLVAKIENMSDDQVNQSGTEQLLRGGCGDGSCECKPAA